MIKYVEDTPNSEMERRRERLGILRKLQRRGPAEETPADEEELLAAEEEVPAEDDLGDQVDTIKTAFSISPVRRRVRPAK